VAARQPDHLVLLGDSVYLDVPLPGATHPMDMDEDGFARHLFERYTVQLAQPQFAALVRGMGPGRVWSTWDDHDFLWNDACGARERKNPAHAAKIRLATAFQEAFRAALAQGLAPGAFPPVYEDARFWDPAQPPLSTPSIALAPDLWLHLADVRSWRTATWLVAAAKRQLLGPAQRQQLAAAMDSQPGAVHLLASGSTLAGWQRYDGDWRWLLDRAARERVLVLSGDIHRNQVDAFHSGGWPLHEATSSGAAVRDAVVIGQRRRNFGWIEVQPDRVGLHLFADDREQPALQRRLDRTTWRPA
jgi:alkaline phosphatase D